MAVMCLSYQVGPPTGISWKATRLHASTLGSMLRYAGSFILAVESTELETKVKNNTAPFGKGY